MNLYLALDLLILAAPLALSFDRRVRFVRRWPSALGAALIILPVYGAWDAWMSYRGDWYFNSRFTGQVRWLQLPPGEWLFFLAAPFSCLFIHEVLRTYLPERRWKLHPAGWLLPVTALLALSAVFRRQGYTSTVLLSAAAFLSFGALLLPGLLGSRSFWLTILVSYAPFLLFNGLLTGLPVVLYSPQAIWGVRLYSIPLEDFFFNFSMLGFSVLAYRLLSKQPVRGGRCPARRAGS